MAALASFPAREVIVGTLGIIYDEGKVDRRGPRGGRPRRNAAGPVPMRGRVAGRPARGRYTVAVALSLMVFFALCCQCASTLAVIRRETSWALAGVHFAYMTALAYVGAWSPSRSGGWLTDSWRSRRAWPWTGN